jgi:hypothetical protein
MVVMISPACAVQICDLSNDNTVSDVNRSPNKILLSKNPISLVKTDKSINNPKLGSKSVQSPEHLNPYSDIIEHASEILPSMEESYENSSEEVAQTGKTLDDLEKEKLRVNEHLDALKKKIDNYEVSTNNSKEYTKLQAEYKGYKAYKNDISNTEKNMANLKSVLNNKQNHTKNCVNALKQIKKSKNIPQSVDIYNSNIHSLAAISNNLANEVQDKKDTVIYSNSTPDMNVTNNTNNTNSSSLNGDTEASNRLLLNTVIVGGVGITIMGVSLVTAAVTAVLILSHVIKATVADLVVGGSLIVGSIGFVVALAGLGCLIAYAGYKWRLWTL